MSAGSTTVEAGLPGAIGLSEADALRYQRCRESGDADACLRLLRRHRSELIVALHEAQRPIDLVDYAIRDLERRASTGVDVPASPPDGLGCG